MGSVYWRPKSLGSYALASTALVTATLLGVVIYLHSLSERNGSLIQARDGSSISTMDILQIRYLPAIIVVAYSMWISVVDLDIKRLEPWYNLSVEKVRRRSSPLLCKYDIEFVLSVISKSIMERHWIVLGSSVLLVTVTIILPAVLNSIFAVRKEEVSSYHQIPVPSSLAGLKDQNSLLYTNFILTSYAITWLNLRLPQFTTRNYALAPFQRPTRGISLNEDGQQLPVNTSLSLNDTYITTATTRYWTELECWVPAAVMINFTTSSVSFDSGRGCVVEDMLSFNSSITDLYSSTAGFEAYVYGPGSEGYNPYLPSLNSQCPNDPHLFLMTFRRAGTSLPDFSTGGNATAMFCEPSYFFQSVNATVRALDFGVVSYVALGEKERLSESIFNITRFENIIANGIPPQKDITRNLTFIVDISDATYVTQEPKIGRMGVIAPNQASKDIMIGFALGTTRLTADKYLDFDNLSAAYRQAHRLLFAQAISYCFEQTTVNMDTTTLLRVNGSAAYQTAQLTSSEETLQILPAFAVATEISLAAALVLCVVLTITVPRRPLHVHRNPDSLAEAMLAAQHHSVKEIFQNLDGATDEIMITKVSQHQFHLDSISGSLRSSHSVTQSKLIDSTEFQSQIQFTPLPATPFETSRFACNLVIMVLVMGIVSIIVTFVEISAMKGLPPPPGSEIMVQIVLIFLPTAAVTLLGLYLSLLCRVCSFMQPMHDLAAGNAVADGSILANYNALPSQLLSWTALRNGHYLLASLSMMALTSNVLTITMAGVFTLRSIDSFTEHDLQVVLDSNFADPRATLTEYVGNVLSDNDRESLHSNYASLTANMSLASWTTPESAIAPRNLSQNGFSAYSMEVASYTSSLDCFDFFRPPTGVSTSFDFFFNGSTLALFANFTHENREITSCTFNHAADIGHPSLGNLSRLNSALEISTGLMKWNVSGAFQDDFCANQLVKGWFRGTKPDVISNFNNPVNYNATMLVCKAKLQTQKLRLNVTQQGDVISAEPLESPVVASHPSKAVEAAFNRTIENTAFGNSLPAWHQNTIAEDWPNRLYLELVGNRDWLNATMQPPSYDSAAYIMTQLFRRMFAVQMSLNRDNLRIEQTADPLGSVDSSNTINESTVRGLGTRQERRVFVSRLNFAISLAILTADLVVLLAFRLTLPKPFLPRMPFTIASQIAFFSNSHIADDILKHNCDLRNYRYGYGQFVGKDGNVHVGIEREPFVYALNEPGAELVKRRHIFRWFLGSKSRKAYDKSEL